MIKHSWVACSKTPPWLKKISKCSLLKGLEMHTIRQHLCRLGNKARQGGPGLKNYFTSSLAILQSYLSSFQNGAIFLTTCNGFHFKDIKGKAWKSTISKNVKFQPHFFSTFKGKIRKV